MTRFVTPPWLETLSRWFAGVGVVLVGIGFVFRTFVGGTIVDQVRDSEGYWIFLRKAPEIALPVPPYIYYGSLVTRYALYALIAAAVVAYALAYVRQGREAR